MSEEPDEPTNASRVVPFRRALYEAKAFGASTLAGDFHVSGTLCGHIDFVGPFQGCYVLSPDEALALIVALQRARADVLEHSDPLGDPRLAP
jgi:hypothetical protein